MTPQEFDVIRAAIKSAYPTFNIMPDRYSIRKIISAQIAVSILLERGSRISVIIADNG